MMIPRKNTVSAFLNPIYEGTSTKRRYFQILKITAVSMVAVIALLVFVALDLSEETQVAEKNEKMVKGIEMSIDMANVIHKLQIERGRTVLLISSNFDDAVQKSLDKDRNKTDSTIRQASNWPTSIGSAILENKEIFQKNINSHRSSVKENISSIKEEIEFYTDIIETLLNWFFKGSYTIEIGSTETDFIAYRLFLISKEKAGLERALGGSYFSRGSFNTSEDFFSYAEQNILGKGYLDTSMILMPEIINVYNKSIELKNRLLASQIEEKRSVIVTNTEKSGSAEQGQKWFQLMTEYIDVLYLIQEDVGKTISNKLKISFKTMQRSLYAKLAILIIVIAGIPVLCVTVFRMTSTIQRYAFVIARKTKELHEEKKRADALLYQMFPKSVADQLKRKQSVRAEHFESVTVYFSDIVGFTKICASISPMQVTFLLNTLYGALDELIEKYDVYKVETIGDAYMVVSGLPNRNGNDHAVQICKMALNIMEVVETLPEIEYIHDKRLSIRAGIHTGPCVAGVVGTKMPRYCLFGDTVNISSRMESNGSPKMIHISNDTNMILNEVGGFRTEFRGYIDVKGKGRMMTYWLKSRTDHLP